MLNIKFGFCTTCKTFSYTAFVDDEDYPIGNIVATFDDDEYSRYKSLCNGQKLIKVVRLETRSDYCCKGVATALLNTLFERHNDANIYLLCHPMPRGNTVERNTSTFQTSKYETVEDLKKFYEKFGFVSCGELLPTMIKKASLPTFGG